MGETAAPLQRGCPAVKTVCRSLNEMEVTAAVAVPQLLDVDLPQLPAVDLGMLVAG